MNTRRGFLGKLLGGTIGFGILPAATSYERVWKPLRKGIPWDRSEFDPGRYTGQWGITGLRTVRFRFDEAAKVWIPVDEDRVAGVRFFGIQRDSE